MPNFRITLLFQRINNKHADFVGLNLIGVLGDCDYTKQHIPDIINTIKGTLTSIKKTANVPVSEFVKSGKLFSLYEIRT